jgi:DNA polymerase-3 subunit alpha
MTETKRETPKVKYVGLHAHSVAGSPFDALGYPQEHMESAYKNGMDALALTDHGNMNGLAYQVLHAKKMHDQGKEFKPIYGCEAYFVPSLQEWHEEKAAAELDKKKAKKDAEATGTTVEDEEASKSAVKDILSRRSHLVLFAANQTGLNNLFTMISKSYTPENFYRYPRLDFDTLNEHKEGVIVSSACMGGVFASDYWKNREQGEEAVLEAMRKTATRFKEIFEGNFYGEVQWNAIPDQHAINKFVIKVCGELDIELVSTSDSHYPDKTAWKDRELYKKLGWLRKGLDEATLPESIDETRCELYPKNGDEMVEAIRKYMKSDNWIYRENDKPLFPKGVEYDEKLLIASVERTHQIAHEKVEAFFPDNTVRLPDFVVPPETTADEALWAYACEGIRTRGLTGKPGYDERLAQEFDVISSRGFSKYFLTMKAISDKAQEVQLVGAGRGSAAGSLIAYCLNITQIDPIKYNLQFERFLRKDAVDYPDIDYDVADPMALKDMLIDEWGDDVVVPISNWNTLQLRSLIKDISKFYNIDFSEVNVVTSRMLHEAMPRAKEANGVVAGVYTPTFEEVMEYSDSLKGFLVKYPHVKTHILRIFGSVRSCSRHAGGVLVGENLNTHMPLISSGGVRQTPWSEGMNVRHLEPMGFIKFDILGLASLRMIEGAIRHILIRVHGMKDPTFEDVKEYYNKNLHPDNIDFSDEKVWKNVFHKGKWAGVFQFTQHGAQKFCKEVKPNNLVDLAAITAIYRPGPLSAGVANDYVKAIENPDEIEYGHPIIKECLQDTYGFIVFQEQLALLAHKLGRDVSLDEGNMLRKLLTKKGTGKGAEVLEGIRLKFVDGCNDKGITERQAMQLWEKMEYFSGYGFNASHAVSYATLSFQCAWLLNYYPIEWVAAFLDKEPEGRKEAAINLAKSLGFSIGSLNVNTSGRVWEISEDGKQLIQPLTSIKGLGDSAIEQIFAGRPFNKVEDFLFSDNMVYSKLNKKALDVLVRSQAMNCLMDDRFTGLKHFWSSVAVERPRKEKDLDDNIVSYAPEGDFSIEEKIEYLTSLTGVFPMGLVVDEDIRQRLTDYCVPAISDYDPDLNLVWFIPRKVTSRKTKNGKTYWVVEVIDENNVLTHIKCWGIKEGKDNIHLNRPYMAKLDHSEQWGFSSRSIRHNFRMLG